MLQDQTEGNITVTITTTEINDVIKILKESDKFGILLKWVTKTVENETSQWKGGMFSMI